MKRWGRLYDVVILIVTVLILLFITLLQDARAYGPFDAEYIANYDGDNAVLAIDIWPGLVQVQNVRFAGVDAPEIRGKCEIEKVLAIDAKTLTADLLSQANEITVEVLRIGKFGRPVGIVLADGNNISIDLIDAGLGREYDGGKRKSWCPTQTPTE